MNLYLSLKRTPKWWMKTLGRVLQQYPHLFCYSYMCALRHTVWSILLSLETIQIFEELFISTILSIPWIFPGPNTLIAIKFEIRDGYRLEKWRLKPVHGPWGLMNLKPFHLMDWFLFVMFITWSLLVHEVDIVDLGSWGGYCTMTCIPMGEARSIDSWWDTTYEEKVSQIPMRESMGPQPRHLAPAWL